RAHDQSGPSGIAPSRVMCRAHRAANWGDGRVGSGIASGHVSEGGGIAYAAATASGTGNNAEPGHHGSGNCAEAADDSIDTAVSRSPEGESTVMDERISVVTPDHVELDFEPAGIGSRLLAFTVDQILL